MQVNNFIQYLDNPEQLKSVSEKEMQPIINEFPYCQTGQLMSVINLNLNNSILFEEQLKRAASICPDRTKLFEHLHPATEMPSVEEKELEVVLEKELPVEVPVSSKEIEAAAAVGKAPLQVKEELFKEEVPVLPKVELKEEEEKPETKEIPEKEAKEKFIPVKGEDELELLEKEYLTTAISSTILLEADEPVETPSEKKEVEKEVELFDEEVEHTFSSWLKHLNGDDQEEENTGANKEQVTNQDIINRFIQEDPRIKPKKTEFYSPTNMARISVTDSGIVSETLALIHVDQRNFQGAIDAYEKLMLKNPKKSSYFAAQIKLLKQKIK